MDDGSLFPPALPVPKFLCALPLSDDDISRSTPTLFAFFVPGASITLTSPVGRDTLFPPSHLIFGQTPPIFH